MDVQQTRLAGIGTRYDIVTRAGRRVAVVVERSGQRELVIYHPRDPDRARETVVLTDEEGDTLAGLLGAPRLVERLTDLHRQLEGLVTTQLQFSTSAPFVGKTLGDTQIRTRTGASVVAVLRAGDVLPSPRPDFRFAAGDVVVVVGSPEATAAVAEMLQASQIEL